MDHKAFIFDFASFDDELRAILERALETQSVEELSRFIDANLESLTDPYEGERLDESWKEMIEVADPHQYGDFALTKYYDPREDNGLSHGWEDVREKLIRHIGNAVPLLGSTVGPVSNVFDPGKMGSYFQSAAQVATSLDAVRQLTESGDSDAGLDRLRNLLESAVGRGLYVTF